jgi:hypothetical protein
MTNLETQLRDHATRMEVAPITLDEMTGRSHIADVVELLPPSMSTEVVPVRGLAVPRNWQRPVLAAAAVALVVGGVVAMGRTPRGGVTTNATAVGPTTSPPDAKPKIAPITKRWLPSYMPAGWRVAEQTETTGIIRGGLSIRRGKAVLIVDTVEPGTTLASPQPGLFSERIAVGNHSAIVSRIDDRVSLTVLSTLDSNVIEFVATSFGFTEQEVLAMAASVEVDPAGLAFAVGPLGSTVKSYLASSNSSVSITVVDANRSVVGMISITAAATLDRYSDLIIAMGIGPIQRLQGGFSATARLPGVDTNEQARILASLVETPASALPDPIVPVNEATRPVVAHLDLAGTNIGAVGDSSQLCVQIGIGPTWGCATLLGITHDIQVGQGVDGKWFVAGIVTGHPTRVVVEFADGTTTDAATTPAADATLFATQVSETSSIRSVTTFGADGHQLEHLGRPA